MRRSVVVYLVAAGIVLALALMAGWWWGPPETVRTGQLTVRRRELGGLLVKAWVSTNRVPLHRELPFWILFENHSGEQVTALRFLHFSGAEAGFVPAKTGRCWTGEGTSLVPACVDVDGRTELLPKGLDDGESIVVTARLRAGSETGSFEPNGVFEWTDAGGHRHRDIVALGPMHVFSPLQEFGVTLGRRAVGVALPLIVLVAGIWFQKWSQRHAEKTQTREGLLPRTLADVQKYYMPVSSRLARLQPHVSLLTSVTSANALRRDQCLWSLLRFMGQMGWMVDKVGGVQFKNRAGEDLVSKCYSLVRRAVEKHLGARNLSFALREMSLTEPLVTFLERFERKTPRAMRRVFQELRCSFAAWILDRDDPFRSYASVLEVFSLTWAYEINAPFETWYEKPEIFPRQKLEELKADLKVVGAFSSLGTDLADYLATRNQK